MGSSFFFSLLLFIIVVALIYFNDKKSCFCNSEHAAFFHAHTSINEFLGICVFFFFSFASTYTYTHTHTGNSSCIPSLSYSRFGFSSPSHAGSRYTDAHITNNLKSSYTVHFFFSSLILKYIVSLSLLLLLFSFLN